MILMLLIILCVLIILILLMTLILLFVLIVLIVLTGKLQPQFNPSDIPFRTMRTMSNRLIKEILPGEQIKHVDLHEGKILLFFSGVAKITLLC